MKQFIILFQILCISILCYAQSNTNPIKSAQRDINETNKVISIPRGTLLPKENSSNSKSYKHNTPFVSNETEFKIIIEKYDEAVKKNIAEDLIGFLAIGQRITFEIMLDFIEDDYLLNVYFHFPGSFLCRYINIQQGYICKWIDYPIMTDEFRNKTVPLMIIYEDKENSLEKKINLLTKGNSLPSSMDLKLEKDIIKLLKNYYLISYQLSDRK